MKLKCSERLNLKSIRVKLSRVLYEFQQLFTDFKIIVHLRSVNVKNLEQYLEKGVTEMFHYLINKKRAYLISVILHKCISLLSVAEKFNANPRIVFLYLWALRLTCLIPVSYCGIQLSFYLQVAMSWLFTSLCQLRFLSKLHRIHMQEIMQLGVVDIFADVLRIN